MYSQICTNEAFAKITTFQYASKSQQAFSGMIKFKMLGLATAGLLLRCVHPRKAAAYYFMNGESIMQLYIIL